MIGEHLHTKKVRKTRMVTIRDVAQKSGFSVTTVSIVLNNSRSAVGIPATTKKHIKAVAQQLSYRPNPFARMLLSNRSRSIAVMVPDITDPYCGQILRGMEEGLYKAGYSLVLADIQNHRDRFKRYLNMLMDRRVEGIIAIANSMYLPTTMLAQFEHGKLPTVVIGRQPEQGCQSSVVVDNARGAREALSYLITLGHTRIAFIRGPRQLVDSDQRWNGQCAAANDFGLRIDPKLVLGLEQPASSYEGGYKTTQAFIKSQCRFTAIVAFDDMTAFGAISALQDAGLVVPGDCSVIGFDDVASAEFYNPPLTTMRQPMEDMGAISVEILLNHLKVVGGTAEQTLLSPVRRVVKPELVIRKSTAPIASDFSANETVA
jgi:DNA-binding LacI/PurR family transcriptional regulator